MKLNHKAVYESVTQAIIEQLEAGTAPWVKPWSSAGWSAPMNWQTGRAYNGINALLLMLTGNAYGCGEFATYKQIKAAGGNVRKGETGHHVVFWNTIEKEAENGQSDDKKVIPFAKLYTVFNLAQCEGVEAKHVSPARNINADTRDADLDRLIAATGARFNEGQSAFYAPGPDGITLPRFETFKSAGDFYATTLHELVHWTAHKSRLARDLSGRFGDQAYAAEELIAELGAAFLCARLGLDGQLQHAEYLGGWLKLMKADKRAIFTAASAASKAADYLSELMGLNQESTQPAKAA